MPDTNQGVFKMRDMMLVLAVLFLVGCDFIKNPEQIKDDDNKKEENLDPKIEENEDDGVVVVLNDQNFPDQKFRWAICRMLPVADGDTIPNKFLRVVDEMDLHESDISSLRGIEYFGALRQLDCSDNQLMSIDISLNKNMEVLCCKGNKLNSIDVTQNEKLWLFNCSGNHLKSLDVSKNTKLTVLLCDENPLEENGIDVSHNIELSVLGVEGCGLKVLDVASNSNLKELYCSDNDFKELNLVNNTKLVNLICKQPIWPLPQIKISLPPNNQNLGEGKGHTRKNFALTWSEKRYH